MLKTTNEWGLTMELTYISQQGEYGQNSLYIIGRSRHVKYLSRSILDIIISIATRVLLSNTRASDVTAATAGISNSASYVLSVSCLFLCGPLRRISVNARFYVQCCLVL